MTCHGPILAQRDKLTVLDCRVCGYAHLDWFPAQAELDAYYSESFWSDEKKGWREIHESQREWLDARNGDWLELVERHMQGRRLLDVGCGWGFFLQSAVSRGWETNGIDQSKEAVDYAINSGMANIMQGSWEDVKPFATYDCVSALWLVEHLPNPMDFFSWCRGNLKSGGVLLLAVPNDFNRHQLLVSERVAKPYYWLNETHINYFDWSSISNLLGRAGFRIIERQTMFQMESYLPIFDYTDNPELGQKLHAEVRDFDLGMRRTNRIEHYGKLAQRGDGREIIIVAKAE